MTATALTAENFDDTVTGNDIVVIDFWAPWCGPCRSFAPIFEKVAEVNKAGVAILMVEQNAKKSLALADRGYVLATGQNQVDGPGKELLSDPEVARLYLGG